MILNKTNGKKYIGKSENIYKRWYDHTCALCGNYHYNTHLQNAWNKYGKDSFDFIVVEQCDKDELNQKEIEAIAAHQANNPLYGYNQTDGGDGGTGISEEAKQKRKISAQQHIEEHPEFIENHRQKTLSQFKNQDFYERYIAYRRSEDFRRKESEAHKNQKPSKETIQKLVETNSKPVLCVETGIVYSSTMEAKRAMPGSINVSAAASGKRKTAGGYHWVYQDKYCTTA